MEDERQKIDRIASALLVEMMNGEKPITQIDEIGLLLIALTQSFVRRYPQEREEFMREIRMLLDSVREACEYIVDEVSKNSTDDAS